MALVAEKVWEPAVMTQEALLKSLVNLVLLVFVLLLTLALPAWLGPSRRTLAPAENFAACRLSVQPR